MIFLIPLMAFMALPGVVGIGIDQRAKADAVDYTEGCAWAFGKNTKEYQQCRREEAGGQESITALIKDDTKNERRND